MNEIIRQYYNKKFMLSMIFDKSVISGISEMNYKENEQRFFKTETLEYLKDTITGNEIVYDSYKLSVIKEYLLGYIALYGDDAKRNRVINLCKEILCVIIDKKQSQLESFYQYEWQLRTDNAIEKSNNMIQKIDKSIALDYTYINALIGNQSMDSFKEDIYCLLSLNAFTVECPSLFMNLGFLNNVKQIIELNRKSTIHEVQVLSNQIDNFIKNLEMDNEEISKIYQEKSILSLLFSPNFEEELNKIDKALGDERFYNIQRFQIFKRIIIEGSENCMFDAEKKERAYTLLSKFRHNLNLSNMEQNDIKVALNQYEDEEYKQKNKTFYVDYYKQHYAKKIKAINEKLLLTDYNKDTIDKMIYYDSYILRKLLEPNLDITELVAFRTSIYSINYIINCYPIIAQHPIYLERISNLLELNDILYSVNGEIKPIKKENKRTLKKIKKLQK